jgi:glucose-6-phosphate isomerase
LTISLAIGFDNFDELLGGADEMDDHFKTDFDQNMPVVLTLLSIWYNNFFGRRGVDPYTQYLQNCSLFSRQVMVKVWVETGNLLTTRLELLFGRTGTNAQHAPINSSRNEVNPSDFIGFVKPLYGDEEHHDKLMSYFAQTEALMHGKTAEEVQAEFDEQGLDSERKKFLLPFKVFAGNKPTNTIH